MVISIHRIPHKAATLALFRQPVLLGYLPQELHSNLVIPTGIHNNSNSSSLDLHNATRANCHLFQAPPTMARQCKGHRNNGVLQVLNVPTWDRVHHIGRMANLTPCLLFRAKLFLALDIRPSLDSCSSSSNFNQERWCIQPSVILTSR